MANERRNATHGLARLLAVVLLSLPLFLSAAQPDSLHTFRFVWDRGMFYVPFKDNASELQRLLALIRQHRESILSGNIPVFVQGFLYSEGNELINRQMVRERSNRVKTEMILKGGLREYCFRTTNHVEPLQYTEAGKLIKTSDRVEVRLLIPPVTTSPVASVPTEKKMLPSDGEAERLPNKPDSLSEAPVASVSTELRRGASDFSLRTNLLRWATLTANLGVEWRFNPSFGILLNGSFANWGWKDKQRRYKVWSLSPEIRYYMNKDRRWFLGAMYQLGAFNYKLGNDGKTGDFWGTGVTGGYRLSLNRTLSMEFHGAAGYTRAKYDRYSRIGQYNVRYNKHGKLFRNYWGINQLGISLLWDF